jgi:hypothetical protein
MAGHPEERKLNQDDAKGAEMQEGKSNRSAESVFEVTGMRPGNPLI